MWIKETTQDIIKKSSFDVHLNFLWKADGLPLYIMDNHLAAAWCWMQECNPNESYCFFHIDRHNDLGPLAPFTCYRHLREKPHVTIDDYTGIRNPEVTQQNRPAFTWDNYINQTIQLFPDWFRKCVYATHKSLDERERRMNLGCNVIEETSPCHLIGTLDYNIRVEESERFRAQIRGKEIDKWIVNIDLDYFFIGEPSMRILTDDYIRSLARAIKGLINEIKVVTVALSPECCGGWERALDAALVFLRNGDFLEDCLEFLEDRNLYPEGWR